MPSAALPINTIIVDAGVTAITGVQYPTLDAACAYSNTRAGYVEIGSSTVTVTINSAQATVADPSLLKDGDILAVATTGQTLENDYKIQSVNKVTGAVVFRCGFRWASGTYSVVFRRPVSWLIKIRNGAYSLSAAESLFIPASANVSIVGESKAGVVVTGNGKAIAMAGTSGSVLVKNMTATLSGSATGLALLRSHGANTVGLASAIMEAVDLITAVGSSGNSIFFIGASFSGKNILISHRGTVSPDIWVDGLDIDGLIMTNDARHDQELMSFSAGGQAARTNYATKPWNMKNVDMSTGYMFVNCPVTAALSQDKITNIQNSRFDDNVGFGPLIQILGPTAGTYKHIVTIKDSLVGEVGSTADIYIETPAAVTLSLVNTTKVGGTPCVVI